MNEENVNEEMGRLPLSSELSELLDFIKSDLSKELPTLTIDLDYFILGVFAQKKSYLFKRLDSCMMSSAIDSIYNSWYQAVSSKALTAIKGNRQPIFDEKFIDILKEAETEAINMESEEITTEHVFLAILSDDDSANKIKKVFNKAGITYGVMIGKMSTGAPMNMEKRIITNPDGSQSEVKVINFQSQEEAERFMENIRNQNGGEGPQMPPMPPIPGMSPKKKGKNPNIRTYCSNLNELAKEDKMEPLIGRDNEVNQIIRILGRKKKNNAILVGGEGVGKTAIGESLALKIVNGDVPEFLLNKELVSLDMTALMAGTTLRGMFEERVKGILDEIKADPHFILFIDNIGATLADKGKNDYDISSMLSRALENGEAQVIGTSDFASYRKTFDKDPSLGRRFQKIIVEAPSVEESKNVLFGLKESYEKFHKVVYDDEAVAACVTLANKYITERNLPDSAIDLLDETGAFVGTIREPESLKNYRKEIKYLEGESEKHKEEKNFEKHDEVEKILVGVKQSYNSAKSEYEKDREEHPARVTKDDILNMVSIKTNIPVNNLTSDDKAKLVHMNERIKAGVVGQDEAIDTICKALKRNRIGLHQNGCMYSAMCIGKTGVGKTLIAKKLAKELFGDEKALVRFDMSEFSDKVAVNKLIGSNPGYVGYEEGGQLTETIKNKKHCVLLLDEIEKADPEIYNIFLQVLDEGFLTDNSGMKVDFKNVIVLFTSNIGAKMASDFGKGIGFDENVEDNTKKILLKQLKSKFPPEFLNRVDDIIYFNSLTDDNLKNIIKIEIGKLEDKMETLGYTMEYGEDVVDYIFAIVKEEKEFGARPIMRAIQDRIEDKITDALLENEYAEGYRFKVSCCSNLSEVVVA